MTMRTGSQEQLALPTRREFALTIATLLGFGFPLTVSAETTVEDWQGQSVGTRGIPSGWEPYRTPGGHPAYDFSVVAWAAGARYASRATVIARRSRAPSRWISRPRPFSNGAGRRCGYPRAPTSVGHVGLRSAGAGGVATAPRAASLAHHRLRVGHHGARQ
jgi:hypothetical protein